VNRIILFLVLSTLITRADDITLSDGTVYKDAKIVSHDAVNATILYAEGGVTVPLAKLPAEFQQKYGHDPVSADGAAAAPTAHDQAAEEWRNYRKALDKYAAVNGKLVTREVSGIVTLNVKFNRVAEVKDTAGQSLGRGTYVDIDKEHPANPATPTASMPSDTTIYLKGYILNADKPVKVDVVKSGATETGGLYYTVVEPFNFDFWKKAGAPQ